MARGWESKAVGADIESAEFEKAVGGQNPLSPAQVELRRKREGLLLSRSRVLHDLEVARNARYREMLRETLAHLEQELARLQDG